MSIQTRPILVPIVVSVRLDPTTGRRLLEAAQQRCVTISDFLRVMITEALSTNSPISVRKRKIPGADVLAAILGELGKIGSNINQLARSANRYEYVDPEALNRALTDLAAIKKLLFKLVGGDGDP